jgi:elongation factor Ts
VTKVYISGNSAVILELNCQTDFVASNDKFVKLANDIGLLLLKAGVYDVEKALQLEIYSNVTIDTACKQLTGTIGEKVNLRRFSLITKKSKEMFSSYEHNNGQIAVLLTLDKVIDPIIGKDIAMHAAAMAPRFLNANGIDAE